MTKELSCQENQGRTYQIFHATLFNVITKEKRDQLNSFGLKANFCERSDMLLGAGAVKANYRLESITSTKKAGLNPAFSCNL